MHGYNPKIPGELNIDTVEADVEEGLRRLHELAKGRQSMKESLEVSQHQATTCYNAKRTTPQFREGDLVLLEIGARNTLDARYEGPCEIIVLVGSNMAAINRVPNTRVKLMRKM